MPTTVRERMEQLVRRTQDAVCAALAAADGGAFRETAWQRRDGGGGTSRVLEGGEVFEKAGVNASTVWGTVDEAAARDMGGGEAPPSADPAFFATGVSVVIHPRSPMVPTAHCNYRYFERGDGTAPGSWWFGGGADLTPAYLFEKDARHFHRVHREACDRHDPSVYPAFKRWCDEYFTLVHRGETRGVGGIFFDGLNDWEAEDILALVADCAAAFLPAYLPVVERRHRLPYTPAQRDWQLLRRGRYVEFNLVYDRGTSFGLRTGGRTDSVLVSLPPEARWITDDEPEPGSPEAALVEVLRHPREWA